MVVAGFTADMAKDLDLVGVRTGGLANGEMYKFNTIHLDVGRDNDE